jgi:hypothetical protein
MRRLFDPGPAGAGSELVAAAAIRQLQFSFEANEALVDPAAKAAFAVARG